MTVTPTIQGLGIGGALNYLRTGRFLARAGWNGKNMFIGMRWPQFGSDVTEPYVYMRTAQGGLIPWLCSQADLLASDWAVVEVRE